MALLSVGRFQAYISNQFRNFADRISSVFARKDETAYSLELEMDPKTFVLSVALKDIYGNELSRKEKNLPLETFLVGGSFDKKTGKITIKLGNGESLAIDVSDMISGLLSDKVTIAGLKIKDNPDAAALKSALGLATVATTGSYNDLANKPVDTTSLKGGATNNFASANTFFLGPEITASSQTKTAKMKAARFWIGSRAVLDTSEEGGGIYLFPPDAYADNSNSTQHIGDFAGEHWHMDVYDGNLRIIHRKKDSTSYVGGEIFQLVGYGTGNNTGHVMVAPPIDHGQITTTISPKSNGSGCTITQKGRVGVMETLVTDITKTSDTVTTIKETCTNGGVQSWTRTTTITELNGTYTVVDNGIEAGAWAQAAFILTELKKKLGV